MTEQIGTGSNVAPPTLTFHIKSMNGRRALIPGEEDGQKGYWCVTMPNSNRQPQDRELDGQKDFEKVLVNMRLMKPHAGPRIVAALPIWTKGLDKVMGVVDGIIGAVSGGEGRELRTWLPILK